MIPFQSRVQFNKFKSTKNTVEEQNRTQTLLHISTLKNVRIIFHLFLHDLTEISTHEPLCVRVFVSMCVCKVVMKQRKGIKEDGDVEHLLKFNVPLHILYITPFIPLLPSPAACAL